MTAEERMGSAGCEDGDIDKFPIGMRVLAVDDDQTCLKILEKFLRECQYEGLFFFFYVFVCLVFFFLFPEFNRTRRLFWNCCLLNFV